MLYHLQNPAGLLHSYDVCYAVRKYLMAAMTTGALFFSPSFFSQYSIAVNV